MINNLKNCYSFAHMLKVMDNLCNLEKIDVIRYVKFNKSNKKVPIVISLVNKTNYATYYDALESIPSLKEYIEALDRINDHLDQEYLNEVNYGLYLIPLGDNAGKYEGFKHTNRYIVVYTPPVTDYKSNKVNIMLGYALCIDANIFTNLEDNPENHKKLEEYKIIMENELSKKDLKIIDGQ